MKGHYLFLLLVLGLMNSCSFGSKIKSGEMAYERKQYAVAVEMLSKEFEATEVKRERARKAYLLGKSYNYLYNPDRAVTWFEKADANDFGVEATLSLARAYKTLGDYRAAIATYEKAKRFSTMKREIDREIFVCREVSGWGNEMDDAYHVEILSMNSSYAEYSPTIYDDNFIVFSSDLYESTGSDEYQWTGNKFSDLYILPKKGNTPTKFDAVLNSEHNEGAATFTKDYAEIIFTRCFVEGEAEGYCKLMYSNRYDGVWSEPEVLPFVENTANYGQATFIEGDTVLVFASDRSGSLGGKDLFYVERVFNEDGSTAWGEVFPMPPTINSQGNEMFPVGHGDTLYFSSDYLPGLGGLDIFRTYLTPEGQWSPPENLKQPVNSSYDDFGYVVDPFASLRGSAYQKGYFSSNRKGYGRDDVYMFERKVTSSEEPELPSEEEELLDTSKYEVYLSGFSYEPIYEESGNPSSELIGKDRLPATRISLTSAGETERFSTDNEGKYIVQLEFGKIYEIKASKAGYLNAFATVSTKGLQFPEDEYSITLNQNMTLNKIYAGQEIVLENIYYDYNKFDIREDAKPTLDSLTIILEQNPSIFIQLGSHTDCRGEDDYNEVLSQKRAESAVNYIVSKGISPNRIQPKGYGETKHIAICDCDTCTEEEHQKNRRTTFRIME